VDVLGDVDEADSLTLLAAEPSIHSIQIKTFKKHTLSIHSIKKTY
jgi:hypothetical protein